MGPLGWPEILFIFVIALIVFGPRKLPQLGRSLGKTMAEFKRATSDLKHSLEAEVTREEERKNRPARHRVEDEYARRGTEKQQAETVGGQDRTASVESGDGASAEQSVDSSPEKDQPADS